MVAIPEIGFARFPVHKPGFAPSNRRHCRFCTFQQYILRSRADIFALRVCKSFVFSSPLPLLLLVQTLGRNIHFTLPWLGIV